MSLVDDHVVPSNPSQGIGLFDDVLVGSEQDLEIHPFHLICQGLSALFVSLEDEHLDGGCPQLEFRGPVGQCREGNEH